MITVICATHRPQNQTLKVVDKYIEVLRELKQPNVLFQLDELPGPFLRQNTFGDENHGLEKVLADKIVPSDRLIVISPEYNGSYPGLFKAFLDAVDPAVWKGKKVALAGVATGRAGNLRGMDHLTDVFHHLRAEVFSLKIPISKLHTLLDEEGAVTDPDTVKVIRNQVEEFLNF